MTPAALRARARVLGALLAWRHHGRRRPTPSHHGRLGAHGAPLRWRRRRRAHVATNGSATDAACQQPPLKPPSGRGEGGVLAVFLLCPSPFFGQAAATTQRRGGRCQGGRACLLRATRRAWP